MEDEILNIILHEVADATLREILIGANELQLAVDAVIMRTANITELEILTGSTAVTAQVEAFRSRIGSLLADAINAAYHGGNETNLSLNAPEKLFYWTVVSAKPCPDCQGRDGQGRTMEEWRTVGLPGSGWSICNRHCRCVLTESQLAPIIT